MSRHRHADLMIAYAENRNLQIEIFSPRYNEWREVCQPTFHQDYLYRIKPNNQRYRLALMLTGGRYYVVSQNENSDFNPENYPGFICWRTDWIEYEVDR